MNAQKIIKTAGQAFILISILSVAYVSILSIIAPQLTMDMVNITLSNNDATSSIRGVYGGVGLLITFTLVYLLITKLNKAITFALLFWGAYALSRVITSIVDGPLGEFGSQWLIIESVLFVIGLATYFLNQRYVLKGQST